MPGHQKKRSASNISNLDDEQEPTSTSSIVDNEEEQQPISTSSKKQKTGHEFVDVTPGICTDLRIKKSPGLDLVYYRQFIRKPIAKQFTKWCLETLNWYRVQYKTRGMQVSPHPLLTSSEEMGVTSNCLEGRHTQIYHGIWN